MSFHIIPVGPNCKVATTLRVMKVRNVSYPWDWTNNTTLQDVINVIKKGPSFDVKTWDKFSDMKNSMPHDYLDDSHNASELLFEGGQLLSKYQRRFSRFFDHITNGNPVYFLRYGDADKSSIDELQLLVPSSKVIHISDGKPDSVDVHRLIYTVTGATPDPYFRIIESILNMTAGITPYSFEHKLVFPATYSRILELSLEMNVSDIMEYINRVFPDKNTVWTDESSLYKYLKSSIKELSGIEYALL